MKKTRIFTLILLLLLILRPMTAYASDLEDWASALEDPASEPVETEEAVSEAEIPSEETAYAEEPAAEESTFIDTFVPEDPDCLGLSASGALIPVGALPLDGEAVLLMELTTGTMLYAENIDARREPASVTKIMTCLLALEYGGLSDEITVTETALETMDPDGSSAELAPGDVYTLEELLYCLMVASANDAALVIAEYLGGSQEGFVEQMNTRAAELGCTDTHFANPHGLHAEDHYTTARDLAVIFSAALEHEMFRVLISTEYYSLPYVVTEVIEPEAEDAEPEIMETVHYRDLYTTDYLISTDINDEYYDPRVIGGKTGFTTPAGRCVVSCAEENGLYYLAVVLGATAWNDEDEPYYGNFITVSALLDAVENWQQTALVSEETTVTVPVRHGIGDALLGCDSSVSALLPEKYDPEDLTLEPILEQALEAPLEADVPVGVLEVRYHGVCVGHTGLRTLESVARKVFSPRLQWIRHGAMGVSRPAGSHDPLPLIA